MIYTIVGTNRAVRDKATKELSSLGSVTDYLYRERVGELESFIDAKDLFGEKVIIFCVQLGDSASTRETLAALLPRMEESSNIFIIDEPFADVHLQNKLKKTSKTLFDGREEKKKDVRVFDLCDSFAKRDKKQAWSIFMELRNTNDAEAISGALWWKFQSVWLKGREGKSIPFSLQECERIGGDLVKASILAHRGEKDLMVELERIILSI